MVWYHSGSDTDGTSGVVEVKRKITSESQSIGTVVLSSFIENSLHPTLNSLCHVY